MYAPARSGVETIRPLCHGAGTRGSGRLAERTAASSTAETTRAGPDRGPALACTVFAPEHTRGGGSLTQGHPLVTARVLTAYAQMLSVLILPVGISDGDLGKSAASQVRMKAQGVTEWLVQSPSR
jgi:hypothetical protein